MNNNVLWISSSNSFKGLLDNVLSGLSKNLDSNIIRNQVFLDKLAAEFILCLAGCRESNLNLLETYTDELLIELNLFIKTHWYYKCLITISQVNTAPNWSLVYILLFHPVGTFDRWHKITSSVMLEILHN